MDIKINYQEYTAAQNNLTSASSETVITIDGVPETTCHSRVLEEYKTRLTSIYALLQKYKLLVDQDSASLQEVKSSYFRWDVLMGDKYNSSK